MRHSEIRPVLITENHTTLLFPVCLCCTDNKNENNKKKLCELLTIAKRNVKKSQNCADQMKGSECFAFQFSINLIEFTVKIKSLLF